ncbi:hypothetical protein [Amycolatopsis sp. cmx-4-83]|uniref:TetR/AcrR family transcriptional regulator n=1 Tax=Amycolatopsis sp. cmx-4-83 TaxID=2790940 RepID=UPI00397E4855
MWRLPAAGFGRIQARRHGISIVVDDGLDQLGRNVTRQALLEAARACFAADAGVDAALVMQFSKSKDELFGAVMSVPPSTLEQLTDAWRGPRDGDPLSAEPLRAMLRGAIANEQAAAQLRDFLEARLMLGVSAHLQDDGDTRLRAVPTIADEPFDSIVATAATALQPLLAPDSSRSRQDDGGAHRAGRGQVRLPSSAARPAPALKVTGGSRKPRTASW